MLEMLGTGISTMLHFIMDNIVIINIILSLIVVFYTDCWIYPVSGHWSGFPQEQDVQGKGD